MINLFSIICQKEKLIRAHCKYATPAVLIIKSLEYQEVTSFYKQNLHEGAKNWTKFYKKFFTLQNFQNDYLYHCTGLNSQSQNYESWIFLSNQTAKTYFN